LKDAKESHHGTDKQAHGCQNTSSALAKYKGIASIRVPHNKEPRRADCSQVQGRYAATCAEEKVGITRSSWTVYPWRVMSDVIVLDWAPTRRFL